MQALQTRKCGSSSADEHSPAVSLRGSPTVSPVTAALWTSVPFWPLDSMSFLALSQAPPLHRQMLTQIARDAGLRVVHENGHQQARERAEEHKSRDNLRKVRLSRLGVNQRTSTPR